MTNVSKDEGAIAPDIREMSFEQALAQLEGIVSKLETGQVSLEESIEIYSRGTQLKRHCEAKLKAAQEKVEKLVIGEGGELRAEPADIA